MLNSKSTMLLLIAGCTILGNVIYYQLKNPQTAVSNTSKLKSGELQLEATPVSKAKTLANINEFNEVTERPLFSNNRLPPAEEVIEQQVAQKPARNPDLKLMGIVLSEEGNVAMIKSRTELKLQRIKLNDVINGWKLVELEAHTAMLESAGQQITLSMTRKADPKQAQKNKLKARQLEQQAQQKKARQNSNQPPSSVENFDGMQTFPTETKNRREFDPEEGD